MRLRSRLATLLCVATISALGAGAAFAGEVKGPPYKGDPISGGLSSNIPATADGKAKSLCAFSGLNDFDADEGQTTKQTQTPADGAPGDPGLGFEVAPGVFISCRGNGQRDRPAGCAFGKGPASMQAPSDTCGRLGAGRNRSVKQTKVALRFSPIPAENVRYAARVRSRVRVLVGRPGRAPRGLPRGSRLGDGVVVTHGVPAPSLVRATTDGE